MNFTNGEVNFATFAKLRIAANERSEVSEFTKSLIPFLSVMHNATEIVVHIHNHITVVVANVVSVMTNHLFAANARYQDSIRFIGNANGISLIITGQAKNWMRNVA